MIGREGGAADGDGAGDPRLPRRKAVEVTLEQDGAALAADGAPRPVQSVEDRALPVDRAVGTVDVLRFGPVEAPAREAGRASLAVEDGNDQAVPEEVVVSAALRLAGEARFDERGPVDAGLFEGGREVVPAVRSEPEAVLGDRVPGEAALPEIAARPVTGFASQRALVVVERLPVGGPEPLVAGGLLRVGLGDRDSGAPRQLMKRFHEGQPLAFHQETEDVAALLAAEAVKETPLGVDVKGGGGLVVEGAEPREAAGSRRTQRHGLADHLDDVVRLPDLLPERLPPGHRSSILPTPP